MSSVVQANVTFQGSITTLGTFGQTTYAPVDLGASALSLASGNLTSLITTSSSAPTGFATAGEGSLVFPGTANAYISFGTTGQPFSNSNIYAFGDFVVEAWVNPTSLAAANFILQFGDVAGATYWYLATVASSGVIAWSSYLNSVQSAVLTNGALTVGVWNHVAVIHQSGTRRLQVYINGVPQTLTTSTGGFTSSGTVVSYTNGIIPVTGQQLIIGQLVTSYFNGSLTNLRITTGSGAAQIYNNNAFTPSTSPLFPASNTAGGSLTTRLLVRVPLATTKMVVPKFGGTNTNSVLAFPPAPMTSYATNMTGQSYYGQGTYVASASSENTGGSGYYAYYAFNKTTGNPWSVVGDLYNSSTGVYAGSVTTVDVNGTSYSGEWLQIQLPSSIVLSNYQVQSRSDYGNLNGEPKTWWVLGSRDGTTWSLVDQRSNITWSGAGSVNSLSVQSAQAFTYYRFVIYLIGAQVGSRNACIGEWTLNGTIEGPSISPDGRLGVGVSAPVQALEVAGSAVVGGTLSAGNPITFKNRIINGDMRIAQRGTTFSSVTANTYTVDRWVLPLNSQSLTHAQSQNVPLYTGFQNSLSITTTFTSGTTSIFEQRLEQNQTFDLYRGTPFVVSFWAIQTAGTMNSLSVQPFTPLGVNSSYGTAASVYPQATTPSFTSVQLSSSWTRYTVPFTVSNVSVSTNGLGIHFWYSSTPSNPSTLLITGVQLEKGTVATPFEFRPYGVELQLCQRYLFQMNPQDSAPCYQRTGSLGLFIIRFPVTMRTGVNPTISGTVHASLGSSDADFSSLTAPGGSYAASATGSQYNFPSTQTVGLGGNIIINSASYIRWDAEL